MTKSEFLEILSGQLEGKLSAAEIYSNIHYYSDYIDKEMASGKSEAEVCEELGDPRLISKTLVDAEEASAHSDTVYEDTRVYEEAPQTSGDSAEEETTSTTRVFNLDLSTWYGKAIVIALAGLALFLLITLVSFLIPFILVIAAVAFIINLIKRYR